MTRDEADENLRAALMAHAEAYELCEPDELLDEFIVVAHWQRIEADGQDRYSVAFNNPDMPPHTAVGLLRYAEKNFFSGDLD